VRKKQDIKFSRGRRRFLLIAACLFPAAFVPMRFITSPSWPKASADKIKGMGLKLLGAYECAILYHIYQQITLEKDQDKIIQAISFIDWYVAFIGTRSLRELKMALRIFDSIIPLYFGKVARFSNLTWSEQTHIISRLKNGPALLYPLFMAIKELSYLAYYRLPENYKKLGYAGPAVVEGEAPKRYNLAYSKLLAATGARP